MPKTGTGRPRGRPQKYPWERWFKRDHFTLRRGVDYNVSQSMFDRMLRHAGRVRGYSLSVVDTDDGFSVWVRARRQVSLAD